MKRILIKLHSRLGETLVETMAAILIFTLSSIILLTMVATSSKLNASAKESDKSISAELNVAEAQNEADGTEAAIKIYSSADKSQSVAVTRFSSGEGKLYSYSYRG